VQGVRRLRKVSVCESEWSIEGLLLQVCAESKIIQTFEVSEVAARSARKPKSSLRLRVVRKLRKDRPSNSAEELCREVVIGSS
jgi:hypothetical protein